MKVLMLVGGFGTRLLPLTETVPKPLVPLAGRPIIDYLLDVAPHDAEVVFTLSYSGEEIRSYLESREDSDRFIFVDEEEPLGTGGAIKNCAEHLDEEFMVFNGDIISDLDSKAMIDFHHANEGIGTIALREVEDPTRFGVVDMDGDRITSFVEKPPDPPTNLINAGMYVLGPEILDMIPEGKVSIEREVFPKAVEHGLFGFRFDGLWTDVGTLPSYLLAMNDLLERRVSRGEISEPVLVAPDASVESELTAPVDVGKGARIGKGCRIRNCAILEGAVVGDGAVVDSAIVSPGAVVREKDVIAASILGRSGERI